jgi:hypothetical protein
MAWQKNPEEYQEFMNATSSRLKQGCLGENKADGKKTLLSSHM